MTLQQLNLLIEYINVKLRMERVYAERKVVRPEDTNALVAIVKELEDSIQ